MVATSLLGGFTQAMDISSFNGILSSTQTEILAVKQTVGAAQDLPSKITALNQYTLAYSQQATASSLNCHNRHIVGTCTAVAQAIRTAVDAINLDIKKSLLKTIADANFQSNKTTVSTALQTFKSKLIIVFGTFIPFNPNTTTLDSTFNAMLNHPHNGHIGKDAVETAYAVLASIDTTLENIENFSQVLSVVTNTTTNVSNQGAIIKALAHNFDILITPEHQAIFKTALHNCHNPLAQLFKLVLALPATQQPTTMYAYLEKYLDTIDFSRDGFDSRYPNFQATLRLFQELAQAGTLSQQELEVLTAKINNKNAIYTTLSAPTTSPTASSSSSTTPTTSSATVSTTPAPANASTPNAGNKKTAPINNLNKWWPCSIL